MRRCWWCWCPGLLAFVFGFFAFRSRIKGVYFSIITQALTYAFMLLFFRNDTGFGGNNGFTDFKRILGFPIATAETRMALFVVTGADADPHPARSRASIVTSKLGRVLSAIRDAESRVMFSGYNPVHYKLFIWTRIGGDLRHRRRALRAAGRHHQPERNVARELDRDRDLGGGGRARQPGRRRCSAPALVNGAKSCFTVAFPRILAVLPRPAVHPGDAVPAAGRDRAAEIVRGRKRS